MVAPNRPKIGVGVIFFSLNVNSYIYKHIAMKIFPSSVGTPCPFRQKTNFKAQNYLNFCQKWAQKVGHKIRVGVNFFFTK